MYEEFRITKIIIQYFAKFNIWQNSLPVFQFYSPFPQPLRIKLKNKSSESLERS